MYMVDNEGSVTTEIKDRILLIGLNRPEKYNGYTPTMASQLVDAITLLDVLKIGNIILERKRS